jgi:hypothetical protein
LSTGISIAKTVFNASLLISLARDSIRMNSSPTGLVAQSRINANLE